MRGCAPAGSESPLWTRTPTVTCVRERPHAPVVARCVAGVLLRRMQWATLLAAHVASPTLVTRGLGLPGCSLLLLSGLRRASLSAIANADACPAATPMIVRLSVGSKPADRSSASSWSRTGKVRPGSPSTLSRSRMRRRSVTLTERTCRCASPSTSEATGSVDCRIVS